MPDDKKKRVEERLVKNVKVPEGFADIPVVGEYFSQLAHRFLNISDDEALLLANVFSNGNDGDKQLKFHNPFVETAIFNLIEPELLRIVKMAAEEKKRRDAEKKKEDSGK